MALKSENRGTFTVDLHDARRLMANAHVYILAEFYQVPKLKEIAIEKF